MSVLKGKWEQGFYYYYRMGKCDLSHRDQEKKTMGTERDTN